jgi:hypothetical protein
MVKWRDVIREEIHLVLGLIILMGITRNPLQKPTSQKTPFSCNYVPG